MRWVPLLHGNPRAKGILQDLRLRVEEGVALRREDHSRGVEGARGGHRVACLDSRASAKVKTSLSIEKEMMLSLCLLRNMRGL